MGQIAAGEVVERPLSVVKELVENALDAGATRVTIDLRRGGLEAIDVRDDGAGIAPADLRLAFARHATSKLTAASDLGHIATLGFRGEGLASIAAVARVRLISRVAGADVGYVVDAHDVWAGEPEPVAAPPGTSVRVAELFANVPVRRDYVSAPGAEFARISTFVATLSLAYPRVTFSLAHDGRPAFVFPAAPASSAASLQQRLAHVFGGAARELLPLSEGAGHDARVRGFVSRPGSDRGDRRMQLLFVNDRLLRSTLLAGAWRAAYATYALAGRHPFGVLFVDVAPEQVDPNVHPTKSDVRLRRAEAVRDAVRRTIARTLQGDAATRVRDAVSLAPPLVPAAGAGDATMPQFAWTPSAVRDGDLEQTELRVMAQLDDTYVLATDGTALVLVDQHAAHERVAYEAIAARARSGVAPSEPLLVPYTIELDAPAAERFEATRATLARAGLDAEPFGERVFRILATPAGYGARAFDVRAYVDDVGDAVAGLSPDERVWASLACHSVVRAGDRLERAEMSALVARLVRCINPMHCPHGRPTIVRIEPDAIARLFKRT